MAFVMLRYVPSIPTVLRVFIKNGCCLLSNSCYSSIRGLCASYPFFNVAYHVD